VEAGGLPLVLWRDAAGGAVAMLDRCPHRNMPLSQGTLAESRVVCAYHGWAFDATGACRDVPSAADGRLPRACVPTFATREDAAGVWVDVAPGRGGSPPHAPRPQQRLAWPSVALVLGAAGLGLYGAAFHTLQNRPGTLGGPITVENAAWLTYAMLAWYVIPACLASDARLPGALRRLQGLLLASFALRGLAEAYLLWGPKAWIPPYGIGHDVATIALVYALRWHMRDALAAVRDVRARRWLAFGHVQAAAMVAEAGFATWFYALMAGQTDRLWFAAYTPLFADLNAVMRVVVPLFVLDAVRRVWLEARALRRADGTEAPPGG
jgi:nitrite reductase/ring-hydroxylating ferredoxin subunit